MKAVKRLLCLALCLILLASPLALNASAVEVVGNYPDVPKNAWYYDAVQFCTVERIITGYKDGRFGPNDKIQRQDFVLILARVAGVNLNIYSTSAVLSKFGDVNDANAYYVGALAWGVKAGIVQGYNNGNFGVGDPITREQICVFIYRYCSQAGNDTVITAAEVNSVLIKYKDGGSVSSFAKNAVAWCIKKGVMNGTKDGYINPTKNALRCEVAQIFYNAYKSGVLNDWTEI